MMTGKKYIELLRCSAWSIATSWKKLPKLVVSTDGTISKTEIRNTLSFWKGSLVIQDWEESVSYHAIKKRMAIGKYAQAHAFGKKLSMILHHAESNPILWIDSDILFYKDFCEYLPKRTADRISCGGTEDWITAYHKEVLDYYPGLEQFPCFNAGLLYVNGSNIYEEFGLEKILGNIDPRYDFFTEQTIFAAIARKSLGILWSGEIVKNYHSDKQRLKPDNLFRIVARHYTSNVRHLFWRDAYFNFTERWKGL